ncbi:MAG: Sua5 family C-terminal domain-containing protein, partial [Ilumatobacter fluminis]
CLVVLADSVEAAERRVDAARADGLAADLLDRTDDVVLAAQLLYADLREADRRGLAELVVVLPPATGIGVAIRDRLTKAAAGGARRRPSRDG